MNNAENIFIFRGNEILVEADTHRVVRQKPLTLEDNAIIDYLDEKTNVPPSLFSIAVLCRVGMG